MQTDVALTWVDRSPRLTRWVIPWSWFCLVVWSLAWSLGRCHRVTIDEISGAGPIVGWGSAHRSAAGHDRGGARRRPAGVRAVLGPQGARVCCRRSGEPMSCVRDGLRHFGPWRVATAMWALAWALGLPMSQTLTPDVISTYAWSVDSVRAFLIVGGLAAAIAVETVFTSSVTAAAAWGALALIGVGLPALTGHASSLGSHGVAMTSDVVHAVSMAVWVGGLLAILFHAIRNDPGTMRALPVFRTVATWAVVLLAISGVGAAFARMNSVTELWTTSFGVLILAKLVLLGGLLLTARTLQTRVVGAGSEQRPTLIRFAGIEAMLMAAAARIGVALTQTAYPRVEVSSRRTRRPCSVARSRHHRVLPTSCWWVVEPLFLGLAILGIGLYVAAVVRLHRRGDAWPVLRTVAWVSGWLMIVGPPTRVSPPMRWSP